MTTLTITAITIGSVVGYVFVAGMVWELWAQKLGEPDSGLATAFWPAIVPFLLLWLVGRGAPKAIAAFIKRPRLPKATARTR